MIPYARCLVVLAFCSITLFPQIASAAEQPKASNLRVFVLDPACLAATKARLAEGDTNLVPALAKLKRDAEREMNSGPFSVMQKEIVPPSGDKHDYMSMAPYFWPNPNTSNGLPYIRRDGERNPEIRKVPDRTNLGNLIQATETLGLAYFYTGHEPYARKAAELLRAWFLNSETKMNPNFTFAQAVRGVNDGRGIGLIETAGLVGLVDAVGLMQASKSWSVGDQQALQAWFRQFLSWMRESKHGQDEAAARNNHGTYYDLQIASFALFTGQDDFARKVLIEARSKRIARQVEPDGRQPLELARTKGWSYSIMNVQGMMGLASLAENFQLDLWRFQSPDGRSIRKALDYLAPFALEGKMWPDQQLGGFTASSLFPALRRASAKYPDYQTKGIPPAGPDERARLACYR